MVDDDNEDENWIYHNSNFGNKLKNVKVIFVSIHTTCIGYDRMTNYDNQLVDREDNQKFEIIPEIFTKGQFVL